jgi:beta-barrel assembly-enhancing protease
MFHAPRQSRRRGIVSRLHRISQDGNASNASPRVTTPQTSTSRRQPASPLPRSIAGGADLLDRRSTFLIVRLLAAAVIGVVAFVTYRNRTESNPFTGDAQRVDLSVQEEAVLGLLASPYLADRHGGLLDQSSASRTVREMGARLVTALDRLAAESNKRSPYRFDFHLLADRKEVASYAMPGGQVFVTAGLFKQLRSEGELAAVLGREVAHVVLRHRAQQLSSQKLGLGLKDRASEIDLPMAVEFGAEIDFLIHTPYRPEAEAEADRLGAQLVVLAGYDAERGLLSWLELIDRARLGDQAMPRDHQAYVRQVIREVFPRGTPQGLRR